MTNLDRKIAELKGLKIDRLVGVDGVGVVEIWLEVAPGSEAYEAVPAWSTSDSKALELVDELCVDQPDGMGARFHLIRWEAKGTKAARWEARIEPYWLDGQYTLTQQGNRFDGEGPTRPEAICHAYIAAREWMAGRGKDGN
jgi:hypothetical protein